MQTFRISIHAPRTGSDMHSTARPLISPRFQSTLPARGATSCVFGGEKHADFNPRSPHGERRSAPALYRLRSPISIHAPRTGSDVSKFTSMYLLDIQSTLPARGATFWTMPVRVAICYFNPRSPHGERQKRAVLQDKRCRFQPTLPARGATPAAGDLDAGGVVISIHAPRTGSDYSLWM